MNFSYDPSNRLTGTTSPAGETSSITYNAWGQESSTTRQYTEGGVTKTITTSAVYDAWGQVIREFNEHGGQVNITYDNMGRIASRTNPFQAGGTPAPATTYQYDLLGRVKTVTWPGNSTVTYTFSGATLVTTDAVNRKTKTELDGLNRLIKVTEQDPAGNLTQVTSYTYDIADRLTQVNQGNQIRSFKYDAAGRLLFEKIPERTATINDGTGTLWTTKFNYTDFGEVATRTDVRGVITTYIYDGLNRLTNTSYNTTNAPGVAATPGVTYTYDNNQASPTRGLLLSVAVGGNYTKTPNYAVNSGNGGANIILASVTYTIEGKTYPVSFQYNQANQRTRLTFPSGRKLNTNYDSKGRLLSLINNSDSSNYLSGLTYNYSGFRTGWSLGNGVAETFTHDANRVFLASQTAVKNGITLLSLSYNYQAAAGSNGAGTTAGNAHQLISVTGSIGGLAESASYTYDLQKRLVTSSRTTNGASAQRQFAYDRWGNRTQALNPVNGDTQTMILQTAGGVPTNRITTIQQTETKGNKTSLYEYNYIYDATGNVTNDGAHAYTYDAENRLVSVDGGATAQYSYDDQNRRVRKLDTAANAHYVWNGTKVIAEHNGSTGAVNVEYVYFEADVWTHFIKQPRD